VQTWSFVLLFKFSADGQFFAQKHARMQSPKTLTYIFLKSFEAFVLAFKTNTFKKKQEEPI
jgi:hypothetical protein